MNAATPVPGYVAQDLEDRRLRLRTQAMAYISRCHVHVCVVTIAAKEESNVCEHFIQLHARARAVLSRVTITGLLPAS